MISTIAFWCAVAWLAVATCRPSILIYFIEKIPRTARKYILAGMMLVLPLQLWVSTTMRTMEHVTLGSVWWLLPLLATVAFGYMAVVMFLGLRTTERILQRIHDDIEAARSQAQKTTEA